MRLIPDAPTACARLGRASGLARVLIVDDDAGVRRMLARSLEAEGYAVALASDGGGALVEIERSAPDLILLDVAMPGHRRAGVRGACAARAMPCRSSC